MMELAGQGSYRQLAEEIGAVLQAAAETAEKMQDDARSEAARLRAEAEAEVRTAYEEGRRILDEARRQSAERLAGADNRLAEVEKAESRVIDRLAGVGQVLADAMAALRERPADTAAALHPEAPSGNDADSPTAKVYFVEFPAAAPPAETPPVAPAPAAAVDPEPEAGSEIVLSENPGPSLFNSYEEHSEWAPPGELPAWWTRGGAQEG